MEQAAEQRTAAFIDQAQLGGVVTVRRRQHAGGLEQIAVEAEGSEQVAGVVGQTWSLRYGKVSGTERRSSLRRFNGARGREEG
jgi:hypothetical protein